MSTENTAAVGRRAFLRNVTRGHSNVTPDETEGIGDVYDEAGSVVGHMAWKRNGESVTWWVTDMATLATNFIFTLPSAP